MRTIIPVTILICAIVLFVFGVQAHAECKANLNGQFVIQQGGRFLLTFQLIQNVSRVTGSVAIRDGNGRVNGEASDTGVDLFVDWSDGGRGRYTWSIDSNGKMRDGITVDQRDMTSSAILESDADFCREQ